MLHLCPSCKRMVYSNNLAHCGYCGAKLPADLFSESYLDGQFTPETAVVDALSYFEKVLQDLRDSGPACAYWVEKMEQWRGGLYSRDITVQRRAIADLKDHCHHQSLGDALVSDDEKYRGHLGDLSRACARVIRIYERQAA
jgi:hypothetical protein